jgi:hypothetical protein
VAPESALAIWSLDADFAEMAALGFVVVHQP